MANSIGKWEKSTIKNIPEKSEAEKCHHRHSFTSGAGKLNYQLKRMTNEMLDLRIEKQYKEKNQKKSRIKHWCQVQFLFGVTPNHNHSFRIRINWTLFDSNRLQVKLFIALHYWQIDWFGNIYMHRSCEWTFRFQIACGVVQQWALHVETSVL